MPDEAAIASLTAIKGIGRWTADIYLMFSLGRLDVLPLGDISIRAALAAIYGVKRDAPAAKLSRLAEAWRPYRSVACCLSTSISIGAKSASQQIEQFSARFSCEYLKMARFLCARN